MECTKCGEPLVRLEDGTYDCRCARMEADRSSAPYPGLDQSKEA